MYFYLIIDRQFRDSNCVKYDLKQVGAQLLPNLVIHFHEFISITAVKAYP